MDSRYWKFIYFSLETYRRSRINEIEERSNVKILVISDPSRSDNRFEVNRSKNKNKNKKIETTTSDIKDEVDKPKKVEKAIVEISPKKRPKRKGSGLFSNILISISGNDNLEKKSKKGLSKKTYAKRKPQQRKKNIKTNQKEKTNLNKDKTNKDKNKTINKTVNKTDFKDKSKSKTKKLNPKKSSNFSPKNKKRFDTPNKADNKKEDRQNIPQKRKLKEDKKIIEIKEPISETKQPSKTAKDWGTASNDPRNKTK
jgi:hypothetical protein